MNPFQATVISAVPFRIHEFKPGTYPGYFDIDGAKEGDFELLVIGKTNTMIPLLEGRAIMMDTNPHMVAEAIVNDYLEAQLARGTGAEPALFWIPGGYTKEEAKKSEEVQGKLTEALKKQDLWFMRLIEIADDSWNRTHQHKTISDIQRYAAKALHMKKEWLMEIKTGDAFKACIACRQQIPANAIKCHLCQTVVDPVEYEKLTAKKKENANV